MFDTSDNRKYRVCNSKLYKMIDLNGTLEQWLPIDEDNNIIERKLMQLMINKDDKFDAND